MLMHRYNFDPDKHVHKESCSDISIVETGGYLTTQQLVEGMVQSGQRLADFRNMMFDADVNLSEDELLDSPSCLKAMILLMLPAGRMRHGDPWLILPPKPLRLLRKAVLSLYRKPVVGEPAPAPGA